MKMYTLKEQRGFQMKGMQAELGYSGCQIDREIILKMKSLLDHFQCFHSHTCFILFNLN